jgi:DNA-binding response OmpR family regulator
MGKLVLIADDDRDIVRFVALNLRLEGFRDQRPDSPVPVIMLTAKSLDADRAMAFTAGADDWVTKPFDPADLVSKVKHHLRAASTA